VIDTADLRRPSRTAGSASHKAPSAHEPLLVFSLAPHHSARNTQLFLCPSSLSRSPRESDLWCSMKQTHGENVFGPSPTRKSRINNPHHLFLRKFIQDFTAAVAPDTASHYPARHPLTSDPLGPICSGSSGTRFQWISDLELDCIRECSQASTG
jgi:hypothetical protein